MIIRVCGSCLSEGDDQITERAMRMSLIGVNRLCMSEQDNDLSVRVSANFDVVIAVHDGRCQHAGWRDAVCGQQPAEK